MQLQLQPENSEVIWGCSFQALFWFQSRAEIEFWSDKSAAADNFNIPIYLFTNSGSHGNTMFLSIFFFFVFKVNKQQRVHSQLDNKIKWEQGTLNLTYCLDQILTCHFFLPGSLLTSPKVTQNTHKLKYFKVCASFCTGATLSQNCLSSYHICPGSHRDTCTCWSLKDIVEGNRKWGMIIYDAQKE